MKILKLGPVGKAAEEVFRGCEYAESVEAPDGVLLGSSAMQKPLPHSAIALARTGADVTGIDLELFTEAGVAVLRAPEGDVNARKELALCALLLGARNVVKAFACNEVPAGRELCGKTLGVIGLDEVGRSVAQAALSLGMHISAYDPAAHMTDRRFRPTRELKKVLKESDFLTLHLPLTEQTRGLFGAKLLEHCRDGVGIVNVSCGELVVNTDMVEAVKRGKVSGYVTDFPEKMILGVENIVCLPRLGSRTPEAEEDGAVLAAKRLLDYLGNGNIAGGVNFPDVNLPRRGAARLCVLHRSGSELVSKALALLSSQGISALHLLNGSLGENGYLLLDADKAPSPACVELIEGIAGVLRVRVL